MKIKQDEDNPLKTLFGVAIFVLGLGILIWQNPWMALGVFLIVWGNNMDLRTKYG